MPFEDLFSGGPADSGEHLARDPEPLLPPVPEGAPWPLHALGGVLQQAGETIRDAVQCPDGLAGASVLTAATLAVQGHVDMHHPLGHAAPCSLVLVTLGESGERKSTADKLALEAFVAAAQEGQVVYRRAFVEHRALMEARDAKRGHIKGKRKNDPRTSHDIAEELASLGADPPPPIPPDWYVSDPNYEGLVKWMALARGSVAWLNNEAGQTIGSTSFADENKLKFGAGLSKFWDGQSVDRLRAGEGYFALHGRRLTAHLMLQPGIARPFLSDPVLRAQGWTSRALICEPPSRIGSRPWREPGNVQTKLAPYYRALRGWIDKELPAADPDGPANVLRPRPIPLDDAARRRWIGFHNEVEANLRAGAPMADHRGFGAKTAENAARIATVLAAFAGENEVSDDAMARGIVIVGYYIEETIRHRDSALVSDEIALAERVRDWACSTARWQKETLTLRDIQRSGPARARDHKTALQCASLLREYGWFAGPPKGPWSIRERE